MTAARRAQPRGTGAAATQKRAESVPQPRGGVFGAEPTSDAPPLESKPLTIIAPYPISTNRIYATVRGRRVKTREAREYAATVEKLVHDWVLTSGSPVPAAPFRLVIGVYPPSRRRIDLSNAAKLLEDAVFAALNQNDKTVLELWMFMLPPDKLDPRASVTLEHIGAALEAGPR